MAGKKNRKGVKKKLKEKIRKKSLRKIIRKHVRKRVLARIFPKKYGGREVKEGVKEHVETNIDRLYELVKKEGMVKIEYAAKKFNVSEEQIEEWGNILEEHGLVIVHYPPFGGPVLILKTFKPKVKIGVKRKRHNKKALLLNFIIIVAFVVFVLLQTGRARLPQGISQNWIYLIFALIIIVLIFLIIKSPKGRKANEG